MHYAAFCEGRAAALATDQGSNVHQAAVRDAALLDVAGYRLDQVGPRLRQVDRGTNLPPEGQFRTTIF